MNQHELEKQVAKEIAEMPAAELAQLAHAYRLKQAAELIAAVKKGER